MGMLLSAVAVLVVTHVLINRVGAELYVPVCVVATAALVLLARLGGVTWDELGMGRSSVRRGLRWGLVLVGVVIVVYGVALAAPFTREAFVDRRVAGLSAGELLYRVFVRVPFGTVLLEEVAFRGVLWAVIRRRWGTGWATAGTSVLFGLWHIVPSRGLTRSNAAVGAVLGTGGTGVALSVGAAVVGTALAGVLFCELRRRSGSLIPSVALHCALNSAGYALAWTAARAG
ncbi:CPBP family intramembrane glutamic endopeptidase [Streptomyces sp. WMMC940]|uniref:CPBP family intramembrane glutamic endopeptidase n=1 Tax=Streptomyces sp. WMMC940 TaxID=3015153 RepID=UPI0022B674E8|nr:CPBP family intramembrane glutamic endopeptidase [Streptomyces sp. WMMC940]MCZ7456881.1 CPBP family intramembrane metalloprotease [Streptomyces sp. WMMC940]